MQYILIVVDFLLFGHKRPFLSFSLIKTADFYYIRDPISINRLSRSEVNL